MKDLKEFKQYLNDVIYLCHIGLEFGTVDRPDTVVTSQVIHGFCEGQRREKEMIYYGHKRFK